MQGITPLTLACGLVSVIISLRGIIIVSRLRWVPITVALGIIMLLRTGLGVPLQDFFPPVVDFSVVAKERAAICVLIFAAIVALGQELVCGRALRRPRAIEETSYNPGMLLVLGALFWSASMLGQLYFLFIKQNIDLLPTAISSFGNPDDHYGYRMYFGQISSGAGRGQYTSLTSLFVFGPIALMLLAAVYLFNRSVIAALLWLSLVCIMPVAALIHGQRSPLVIFGALAFISFIFGLWGRRIGQTMVSKKIYLYAAFISLVVVMLGASIYRLTNKVSVAESIALMLERLFIVPAVTPNFIYELIPEQFGFRGFLQCFYMHDRLTVTTDVTYGDLAIALTGASYNVNSGAFTVGYSGLGFAGSAMISAVMVAMAVGLDRLLINETALVRITALILNLDPLQLLTSEGLFGCIQIRGYIFSALIVVACLRFSRRRAIKPAPIPNTRPAMAPA